MTTSVLDASNSNSVVSIMALRSWESFYEWLLARILNFYQNSRDQKCIIFCVQGSFHYGSWPSGALWLNGENRCRYEVALNVLFHKKDSSQIGVGKRYDKTLRRLNWTLHFCLASFYEYKAKLGPHRISQKSNPCPSPIIPVLTTTNTGESTRNGQNS